MKLFNKPWFLASAVAVSIGIGSLAVQGTQNLQALQMSTAQAAAKQRRPAPSAYNGPALYEEVYSYIRDGHFNLGDTAKRNAFVAAWQNKFASKKVKDIPNFALEAWGGKYDDQLILGNPETADHAIDLMLLSMGFLHDSYMKADDVEGMGMRSDPSFAGVGVEISIRDYAEQRKALMQLRPKDLHDKAAMADFIAKAKALDDVFAKISIEHPLIVITPPFEGSPGLAAGLRKGDALLEIGQNPLPGKQIEWVPLAGKTTNEAVKLIRGKINTPVHIKVGRVDASTGVMQVSVVTVTRGRIVPKVVSYKDLGNCTSYVKLNDFMSQFGRKELKKAFDQSLDNAKPCNGAGGVVIDFRDNSGGNIRIAYALESMLMERGVALVTKQRTETGYYFETTTLTKEQILRTMTFSDKAGIKNKVDPRNDWNASVAEEIPERVSDSDIFTKVMLPKTFKIVALINGGSASASEIMAGTLQGERIATLVGEPSFGKGEGQTIIPLENGGVNSNGDAARMLRLTSFEFLPSGTSMNHVGVIPDIVVEYQPAADSEDPVWDAQVKAAKAEILRQLGVQATQDALRTKMGTEKRKTHDSMFQGKKFFIETGKRPAGDTEE